MKQLSVQYLGRKGAGDGATVSHEQIDVVTAQGTHYHFTYGSATAVNQSDWPSLSNHSSYRFVAADSAAARPTDEMTRATAPVKAGTWAQEKTHGR
jgi:hypothetical protein